MSEAASAWKRLGEPWRVCFELAWEACAAGSVGVGAVVTDAAGTIVAAGRNHIGERDAPPGRLANTPLAHAEVNALAGIPLGDYSEHTLYTSLEPCVLCAGATVMAGVGTVRYAAPDPLFEGCDGLATLNPWVSQRWPRREQRERDVFSIFAMLLPLSILVFWAPDHVSIDCHQRDAPAVLTLARAVVASGELIDAARQGTTAPEVLDQLWDRLTACQNGSD